MKICYCIKLSYSQKCQKKVGNHRTVHDQHLRQTSRLCTCFSFNIFSFFWIFWFYFIKIYGKNTVIYLKFTFLDTLYFVNLVFGVFASFVPYTIFYYNQCGKLNFSRPFYRKISQKIMSNFNSRSESQCIKWGHTKFFLLSFQLGEVKRSRKY